MRQLDMLSYVVSSKEASGATVIFEHEKDNQTRKTWKGQPPSSVQVVTQQQGTIVSGLELNQTVVGFGEWSGTEKNHRVPKTTGETCSPEEIKVILRRLSTE